MTTTAPPLSAGLMIIFLLLLRLLSADFSSLLRLWNLVGGTLCDNKSISFCLQNSSKLTTGGGFHLEGSSNLGSLKASSGDWMTPGRVGSTSSSFGRLLKKRRRLIRKWNWFKSCLRSPKLGSPGVGQNFIPFASTLYSASVSMWSEMLTTSSFFSLSSSLLLQLELRWDISQDLTWSWSWVLTISSISSLAWKWFLS